MNSYGEELIHNPHIRFIIPSLISFSLSLPFDSPPWRLYPFVSQYNPCISHAKPKVPSRSVTGEARFAEQFASARSFLLGWFSVARSCRSLLQQTDGGFQQPTVILFVWP